MRWTLQSCYYLVISILYVNLANFFAILYFIDFYDVDFEQLYV